MSKFRSGYKIDGGVGAVFFDFCKYLEATPGILAETFIIEQQSRVCGITCDEYLALSEIAYKPFRAVRTGKQTLKISVRLEPTVYEVYIDASTRYDLQVSHLARTATLLGLDQNMQEERFTIPDISSSSV